MPSSVEFVRHPKADKYHSPAVLEGRACQDLTTALTGSLDRCWKIASGWVARGYSRGESVASLDEAVSLYQVRSICIRLTLVFTSPAALAE